MTAIGQEQIIILAFGIISGLSAYFSFVFMDSPDIITKSIGRVFFSMSILFLLLILNTVILMVKNDATLTYLDASIIDPAMMVVYYSLILGVCAYILFLIIGTFQYVKNLIGAWQSKKRAPRQEEGT